MAMLFNRELHSFDAEVKLSNLEATSVSEMYAEHDLIDTIQSLQRETATFCDILQCAKNRFKKFSSNKMRLSGNLVTTLNEIGISGKTVKVLFFPDNDGAEFINKASLNTLFSSYIYKLGNLFQISNMAINTNLESSTKTLMMTYDVKDSYFLARKNGEFLTTCTLLSYGQLLYESVPRNAALPRVDIESMFFLRSTAISFDSYEVNTPRYSLGKSQIVSLSLNILSSKASRLEAENGAVNVFNLLDTYLSREEKMLADSSSLSKIESRTVYSVNETRELFRSKTAPITGWISVDLKKDSFKSDTFLDVFTDVILANSPVSDSSELDGINSAVCKSELDRLLSGLFDKLINVDVCDDN